MFVQYLTVDNGFLYTYWVYSNFIGKDGKLLEVKVILEVLVYGFKFFQSTAGGSVAQESNGYTATWKKILPSYITLSEHNISSTELLYLPTK